MSDLNEHAQVWLQVINPDGTEADVLADAVSAERHVVILHVKTKGGAWLSIALGRPSWSELLAHPNNVTVAVPAVVQFKEFE